MKKLINKFDLLMTNLNIRNKQVLDTQIIIKSLCIQEDNSNLACKEIINIIYTECLFSYV